MSTIHENICYLNCTSRMPGEASCIPVAEVMNTMTAEDYKESYWPRLEKAVEQLLTQSPVKYSCISYEQIYRTNQQLPETLLAVIAAQGVTTDTEQRFTYFCQSQICNAGSFFHHVYECVCQQYSEQLYRDLIWKITSHLQQVCQELHESRPESFVENFNIAFTQYMAAMQCIIPVFIYMNKCYIETKLNRNLKDDLMDLFSAHVAEKHINTLICLLKKADAMPFQVKPSTMASVVKGLYDLQPDWAQLAPALFSRFIPQIHPPVLESDLLHYAAQDRTLQMELTLNGFSRCDHSRKRASEES